MASKEQFLNHIAKRLGRERRSDVKPPVFQTDPWQHLYKDFSQADYIDLFIENLTALTGEVKRAANQDELVEILREIIQNEQAKTAVLWQDERLEELNVSQFLKNENILTKNWDPKLNRSELIEYTEKADLGLTFAEMGLAETGSILLYNQDGKGKSVSLLPKVFVSFLRARDIQPRITSALKYIHERHQKEGLPSVINFITGPSRSADIEMSLSIGVHGPGKVYVILLDE